MLKSPKIAPTIYGKFVSGVVAGACVVEERTDGRAL